MKTTEFQLKNGLKVILTESHKSPVVSVQMWVRTGSADEKKKEEGISHFIEHLVFKGTRKFKVGEIASIVEGAGGELNAYTSFDQTVFYVTLSKQFTETGLEVISEMMGFPIFDPKEIDNEREVVVEEIKRGLDSLGRQASENLFSTNYRKHPYGIPVIGYEKNVREMSAKKIVNFYQSRYAPKNMFLLVSGDFESADMKKQIAKHFAEIKDYKIKSVKRTKEPKQTKLRVSVEKGAFEQSIGYLSWKIPSIKNKDIPALDVLGFILGQGESSRLVQKLRIQSAVVNSVGASSYTPMDEGLFAVSIGYNKENLAPALKGIQEVIVNIMTQPVEAGEIQKAVLNIESEEFYGLETVDGLSRRMGSQEFYFKDLKAQEKYLMALGKLTPQDILKVARKYIHAKTFAASVVTNDEVKKVEKEILLWQKGFFSTLKKTPVAKFKNKKVPHEKIKALAKKASKNETEKVVLKNGVTVLLRPSSETEVISAKAALMGGQRIEAEGQGGLTELLGRTWSCGTKNRSEEEISHEVESMASGLSPITGRNSIGLGQDILAGFQKRGADLFLDLLLNPTFPEEAVEREKLVQLEQIKSKADNPGQCCARIFMKDIFSGHPYSRDMLGDESSLRALNQKHLLNLWNEAQFGKNLTLSLCGNFDRDFWLEKIESATSKLSPGKRQISEKTLAPLEENILGFEHSKKEQSHVIYGFRGLSLTDERRYTLHILQSILAGQGGRLFIELRDKNSLAYSVSPMRMEGIETGYFGAHIGCSPEKVSKAVMMMEEQFQLLVNKEVGEQELKRAQRYLIGRHDIDLQRTGSVAAAILYSDIYGVDYNEVFTSAEKYFSVTAKQVKTLAQQLFSENHVLTVVGPNNPF